MPPGLDEAFGEDAARLAEADEGDAPRIDAHRTSLFLQKPRVVERRVLAAHRVRDRLLEGLRPLPFGGGPDMAFLADLVEAPVDLEPVPVGVTELDGDLAAGAAAAVEIDRHVVLAQMFARP